MDSAPFDFEITGAAKIQQVVKEHRNATLSFKDACRIWTQHSEDRYCAGWIDMDVFKDDLDKEILEAYDTYALPIMIPVPAKSLKDKLKDWTDIDVAEYELAKAIGLMNENVPFPTDAKHIFWTNNPIGNMLYDMVVAMKKNGILEENIDQQFRWNSNFKGSWEKETK